MDNNKENILSELTSMLHELFEIPLEDLSPEASLYEDLDLDSIDAVDLIVQLQSKTNHKFTPEEFKSVKTISDVVDVNYNGLNAG